MIRVELTEFAPLEKEILEIRFKVFVDEQGVDPDLEVDGRDPDCLHAVAFESGSPIGTGRLLPDRHIGRMAVLKERRNKGVGQRILQKLVDAAKDRGWSYVALSSQVHAIPFYERFGFKPRGAPYVEAGLDHIDMRLDFERVTPQLEQLD